MLNIFNFGKIKLINGVKLSLVNLKKNYKKLMEFYNQDPAEFQNLYFLQAENLAAAATAFKDYKKEKSQAYLIHDNLFQVGIIEEKKWGDSILITAMIDPNYVQSPAFKIAINHLLSKNISKSEVIVKISPNDTNTIEDLKSMGIEGNIFYISSEGCFLFIGQDFDNIGENDWKNISENFSFQEFFSNNWISQNQNEVNDQENTEELQEDFSDFVDENENQQIENPNDENLQVENSNDENDQIEVDNNYQVFENSDSNQEVNYDQSSDLEAAVPAYPSFTHQLLNKEHDEKDFITKNVMKTIEEISKIPETDNYSKTNTELFKTIKNTLTFKDFQDSSIKDVKYKSKVSLKDKDSNPKISLFKQKLAEIREKRENEINFSKNENQLTSKFAKTSQEDKDFYKTNFLKFESKTNDNENDLGSNDKKESYSKKTKGFGSRVISI